MDPAVKTPKRRRSAQKASVASAKADTSTSPFPTAHALKLAADVTSGDARVWTQASRAKRRRPTILHGFWSENEALFAADLE